jgi:8-oxo-dGTP diphosphatase
MTNPRGEDRSRVISIVAAVIADETGRTLLVRKRGTRAFMQPGGKPATGEAPLAALGREIEEELGCTLEPDSCRALGSFDAPAANEPGFTVVAQLFTARLRGLAEARGEIEEIAWIDPEGEPSLRLAPLTRTHAMPIARNWKLGLADR